MTLYRRLTMIITGGIIEHVFYPIFPPDTHAQQVLTWLTANRDGANQAGARPAFS